jgi:transcriptional regulator with XRE-family HTH domain
MNKIGIMIRKMREQRGLSQENMSLELGISQPAYARLEKKDNRINIPRLIQIAVILGTTVSKLINEKVEVNLKSEAEHIQSLKDEITFLRKLLRQQKKL